MKQVMVIAATVAATWLAWLAWQPPVVSVPTSTIRTTLPENRDTGPQLWRIVTKRMVWKKAIDTMKKRLQKEGFTAELISKREPVELHTFDDPRIFKDRESAEIVKAEWVKKGVEAEVLKREITYIVGFGRFYLTAYAEQMQAQLKKTGKAYNYSKKSVEIPAYHFVFRAMEKDEANRIWQRLKNLGIADPVMIRETEYQKIYDTKTETIL